MWTRLFFCLTWQIMDVKLSVLITVTKMLEEARNNAGKFKARCRISKMDVQNLAFQDETFDLGYHT